MIRLKNFLTSLYGRYFGLTENEVSEDLKDIYNDVYIETLEELLHECQTSEKAHKDAVLLLKKIKFNKSLTPEEVKKLGILEIKPN